MKMTKGQGEVTCVQVSHLFNRKDLRFPSMVYMSDRVDMGRKGREGDRFVRLERDKRNCSERKIWILI